jgi:hypothetical protein
MGQQISRRRQSIRQRTPDSEVKAAPSSLPDPQIGSSLLQLPVYVILLIADRPAPEAVALLSLTCKATYHVLFDKARPQIKRDLTSRRALLFLLERDPDIGRGFSYCTSAPCYTHYCLITDPVQDQFTLVVETSRAMQVTESFKTEMLSTDSITDILA